MQIFATTFTGRTITLEVARSDTVARVKQMLENQIHATPDQQRIIFRGKQIEDHRTLADYDVEKESTIHVVLRTRPPPFPTASILPSREVAEAKIQAWKTKAERGNFDDDICIVDPQAHYSRLNSLEKDLVEASEFFRCNGAYDPLDNSYLTLASFDDLRPLIPDLMWSFIQRVPTSDSQDLSHESPALWQSSQQDLISLRKSYLILCRVLTSFDRLKEAGFCTSSYNLLLKHTGKDVAEIVRISRDFLDDVKIGIETATKQICNDDVGPEAIHVHLQEHIKVPCSRMLEMLHLPCPEVSRSSSSILVLCRMTAILLDLALVSYVGSHGTRFDLDYIQRGMSSITVHGSGEDLLNFDCTLRQLACLDVFLDHENVWVFQCSPAQWADHSPPSKTCPRLSILTRMEDFADIWGPVWPVPAGQSSPGTIKRYKVSKGFISRVSDANSGKVENAVKCHFESWSSFHRRRVSTILPQDKEHYLAKDDLLLIGTRFRENEHCSYTLDDFERDYGYGMGVLGATRSRWETESRTFGISFSKIIGIGVQGTQKKRPQTSIKQHILEKWKNNPTRANPGVLNQLLGVEVSHCTGNAIRVPLKDLLLMSTVQPFLELQSPGWKSTTWGAAFLLALGNNDPEAVFEVWMKHEYRRPEMADLVCNVLEVLDKTGKGDDGFTAAFLNNRQERSITLDLRFNDWSHLLQDSSLMAVFAVVNESCIECHTPDHSTATCDGPFAHTVLGTQLGVENSSSFALVKVQPLGQILKTLEKISPKVLLMVPASAARTYMISTPLGNSATPGVELRDLTAQSGIRYDIFLRASDKSHNGMETPRERVRHLKCLQPAQQPVMQEPFPCSELSLLTSEEDRSPRRCRLSPFIDFADPFDPVLQPWSSASHMTDSTQRPSDSAHRLNHGQSLWHPNRLDERKVVPPSPPPPPPVSDLNEFKAGQPVIANNHTQPQPMCNGTNTTEVDRTMQPTQSQRRLVATVVRPDESSAGAARPNLSDWWENSLANCGIKLSRE